MSPMLQEEIDSLGTIFGADNVFEAGKSNDAGIDIEETAVVWTTTSERRVNDGWGNMLRVTLRAYVFNGSDNQLMDLVFDGYQQEMEQDIDENYKNSVQMRKDMDILV